MSYAPYNVTVVQGDGESRLFKWDDGTDPTNIATWTIFATVKKNNAHADTAAVISYDSDNDATAIVKSDSGANGFNDQFHVNYLAADTNIPPGVYQADVKVIIGSSDPWTVAKGTFTVEDHSTKRVTT